ncbi:MAG: hypothetical protein J7K40_12230, partial [candidate division Zixibacteria bacterium]|nr:hypothetical protein [candidate division Zixibacteria bacterium]
MIFFTISNSINQGVFQQARKRESRKLFVKPMVDNKKYHAPCPQTGGRRPAGGIGMTNLWIPNQVGNDAGSVGMTSL